MRFDTDKWDRTWEKVTNAIQDNSDVDDTEWDGDRLVIYLIDGSTVELVVQYDE